MLALINARVAFHGNSEGVNGRKDVLVDFVVEGWIGRRRARRRGRLHDEFFWGYRHGEGLRDRVWHAQRSEDAQFGEELGFATGESLPDKILKARIELSHFLGHMPILLDDAVDDSLLIPLHGFWIVAPVDHVEFNLGSCDRDLVVPQDVRRRRVPQQLWLARKRHMESDRLPGIALPGSHVEEPRVVFSRDQFLGRGSSNGIKGKGKRLEAILLDEVLHVLRFIDIQQTVLRLTLNFAHDGFTPLFKEL